MINAGDFMSRIKTIGSSLKAFSARMRRIPLSYRTAGGGLLLAVVLLNSLLMPGCVPLVRTGAVHQGHLLKGYEFDNVRFDPLDSLGNPLPIRSASAYWLKLGEKVALRFDTYEVHWERDGASPMCGFIDNTSAGDCQICDFCNPPPSFDGPPCFGVIGVADDYVFKIVAHEGFIETNNPKSIIELPHRRILEACGSPFLPVIFQPEASGLYRTMPRAASMNFKGETNGEIKLHVVETTAKAAYPLTRRMLDCSTADCQMADGTNYWTWPIEGNPLWAESFSPNLRVTDIRILRGPCGDGSAQGGECDITIAREPVKPSRILFLPNFESTVAGHDNEATNRCYSNPNASDGNYINLLSCRERYDYPLNLITPKSVTPTNDPAEAMKRLTWLVEFNTNEGADDMSMSLDAGLVIEFTIQVK